MSDERALKTVTVTNPQGLHARPADLIVKLANQFQSRIELLKGNERVDAKSILTILTLAAAAGTELSIEAVGPDARQAVDALAELIETNFSEEEDKMSRG